METGPPDNSLATSLRAQLLADRVRSAISKIHGEAVNLGILLMAHIQGNNPDRAADIIQTAKMRFQPEQLGITWPIAEGIVMQLPEFARNVPWHTIVTEFDRRGEDGRRDLASRFAAARDYVERLGLVD